MKKIAFTIIEIIVVLVIVGILVTLGIPVYQNIISDSKAKVCETNLKALATALELYAVEHDILPAVLSELDRDNLKEAYRRILNGPEAWKIKLAFIITDWKQMGLAHASFLSEQLAKGNVSLITCPVDRTPPSEGGASYGINSILANLSYPLYKALPDAFITIADCDNATFTRGVDFANRHSRHMLWGYEIPYFQVVTKGKNVLKNLYTPGAVDGLPVYMAIGITDCMQSCVADCAVDLTLECVTNCADSCL